VKLELDFIAIRWWLEISKFS